MSNDTLATKVDQRSRMRPSVYVYRKLWLELGGLVAPGERVLSDYGRGTRPHPRLPLSPGAFQPPPTPTRAISHFIPSLDAPGGLPPTPPAGDHAALRWLQCSWRRMMRQHRAMPTYTYTDILKYGAVFKLSSSSLKL